MTIFHAIGVSRRELLRFVLIGVVLAGFTSPAPADPTPSLDQLYVIDQGHQFTVIWHFYYKLLPPKFSPLKNNSSSVALDDPATLKENLTALASMAFDLTLDGRPGPLTKITEVTLAPDGGCFVTMLYPGRKKGRIEFRDNLLPFYPASYVMNYEIYSPLARSRGLTGYFTGGALSPTVDYVQINVDAPSSVFDIVNTAPIKLFKAELRTAWADTNWLFVALMLVLVRPTGEIPRFALILFTGWFLPHFFWVMDGLQIPFLLHPVVPGLATLALASVLLRPSLGKVALMVAVAAASVVDGCFDIQQTSLEKPPGNLANLAGLSLGFAAGLGLAFIVILPIVTECRKFSGFQKNWVPKICGCVALAAVILPWVT